MHFRKVLLLIEWIFLTTNGRDKYVTTEYIRQREKRVLSENNTLKIFNLINMEIQSALDVYFSVMITVN